MRVDIQRIDEACSQMEGILHRLQVAQDEMNRTVSNLKQQNIGTEAATAAILNSLMMQLAELKRREEGMGMLLKVLYRAGEEYRSCETEARQRAQSESGVGRTLREGTDILRDICFTEPQQIDWIIRDYVKPFIVTGK